MAQPAADQPRRGSGDWFGRLFATSPIGLALLDEHGRVLDANPALVRLLDQPREWLLGQRMIELTHPDDRPHVRAAVRTVAAGERETVFISKRLRRRGGAPVPVRVTLLRLDEPTGRRHRLAQIENLGPANDHEKLRRQALEDPLTGAGNRRALHDRLTPLLDLPQQPDFGWSLLFVDLDGFKQVNDVHGHAVGDAVLATVAGRLSRLVRADDLVCRLGGDEFVVLLGTADPADVGQAETRIRRSLAQPVQAGDVTVQLSASVGSAVPQPEDSAGQVLGRADAAMYRDKASRPPT